MTPPVVAVITSKEASFLLGDVRQFESGTWHDEVTRTMFYYMCPYRQYAIHQMGFAVYGPLGIYTGS